MLDKLMVQQQLKAPYKRWKHMVAVMCLNLTYRKQVKTVLPLLFEKYPTPAAMSNAVHEDLSKIIKPLGFYNRRARSLVRMSKDYLTKDWSKASELYGCGKYADDCYKVFCTGEWKSVEPTDHALNDYVDWLKKEKDYA